jgi:hypothetical protein
VARRCHSRCISNANRKQAIATSAVWALYVNLTGGLLSLRLARLPSAPGQKIHTSQTLSFQPVSLSAQ